MIRIAVVDDELFFADRIREIADKFFKDKDIDYEIKVYTHPVELRWDVEDGDYWKIDNIVLGYNFKKDFIKGIKGMRLYFSVQNALTITGYKGLDPEVGGSLLTPGTDDRNKYPTTRSYTFGVNLNF